MRRHAASSQHRRMTKLHTPRDAAMAVIDNPTLPTGHDERVVGFGVMGLPFASGHYLAFRDFPATSFSPGYLSVWHRDPIGVWKFYATTPGYLSCSRYFSSATPCAPVQRDIEVDWPDPWTVVIAMDGLLEWQVDIHETLPTRFMSAVGTRLPERAWTSRSVLALMGRAAGPALGAGKVRLSGALPNGQRFMIAPKKMWAVAGSRAVLRGEDLGPVGPLSRQARLGDFRLPQRGICVVGQGHFETFDACRHRGADLIASSD